MRPRGNLGARPSNALRAPGSALRAGSPHEFRPFFAGGAGLLGACSLFSGTLLALLAIWLAAVTPVLGQQAAPPNAPPAPGASSGAAPAAPARPAQGGSNTVVPAAPGAPPVPPADTYTYSPEGRRDPFVSLLGTGVTREPRSGRRAEGLAGLTLSEINLKGILQSRGSFVAMVQGPDAKTYLVHANDRLLDGVVKTITAQSLVVLQEVHDPLSLVKQREVRKLLRPTEETK